MDKFAFLLIIGATMRNGAVTILVKGIMWNNDMNTGLDIFLYTLSIVAALAVCVVYGLLLKDAVQHKLNGRKKAYNKGYAACKAGNLFTANPHAMESEEGREWLRGYCFGQREGM